MITSLYHTFAKHNIQLARTMTSDSLEAGQTGTAFLRFATMPPGALCATISLERLMPMLCADSLDSVLEVSIVDTLSYCTSSSSSLITGAIARTFGFVNGRDEIFLDNVQCLGTENRLIDCPASPIGTHNCVHNEDVGITCQRNTEIPRTYILVHTLMRPHSH